MMKEYTTIYKVSLTLASATASKNTDLNDLKDDVMQACDEHNHKSDTHILPLIGHKKRVILLVNAQHEDEAPGLDCLTIFTQVLTNDLGWNRYGDTGQPLFEITCLTCLTVEDCCTMLGQERKHMHNALHTTRLRDWLGEYLPDGVPQYKYRGPGRPPYDEAPRRHQSNSMSLEEAMLNIESMVGMDGLKQEVHNLVRLAGEINGKTDETLEQLPYCLVINRGPGVEVVHGLQLLTTVMHQLRFAEDDLNEMMMRRHPMFGEMRSPVSEGVNYAYIRPASGDASSDDFFQHQMRAAKEARPGQVFIFILEEADGSKTDSYKETLHHQLYCRDIHLPAYTPCQLTLLVEKTASKKGFALTDEAKGRLAQLLEEVQASMTPDLEIPSMKQMNRMVNQLITQRLLESPPGEGEQVIEAEEVEAYFARQYPTGELHRCQQATDQLSQLVGLDIVKQKVREITNLLLMQQHMKEEGIEQKNAAYHMIFTGNPGTGKTVVARMLGNIFRENGLLSKGHFVEVGRDDLVAAYVGQTALRTRAKIKEAMGGVLFIDEAYSLNGGHERDYGHEALSVLVKEMENHREDLVVILAGYPDEMERLISMNTGLRDRIPHKIHFPDYECAELVDIFNLMVPAPCQVEAEGLTLLNQYLHEVKSQSGKVFANGRFVRNTLERVEQKKADRLAQLDNPTREDIITITADDIRAAVSDPDLAGTWDQKPGKPILGFKA